VAVGAEDLSDAPALCICPTWGQTVYITEGGNHFFLLFLLGGFLFVLKFFKY
jgi:hypothetical protein